MKPTLLFFIVLFFTLSLNAQLLARSGNGNFTYATYKTTTSKELKTARFFIVSGYLLTAVGGLLWVGETALNQLDTKPKTTPFIIMTTVGVGSLILGYSLKSKANRKSATSISLVPQQVDLAYVKPGIPSVVPSLKIKVRLQ